MILKDLLQKAKPEMLVKMELEFRNVDQKPIDLEHAKRVYSRFLQEIQTITPIETGYILIGTEGEQQDGSTVDVELFIKEEILKNNGGKPQPYGYEFSPWEEVLGYEVDETSLSKLGDDLFIFLAVYEMTFNGFTQEDQNRQRERLIAAIKEVKELSMLSEEELEKTGRLWKSVCDESREQREDIPIIEEHDPGDCFWIWPVKIHIDEGKIKQVEGLPDNISIQEEDFEEYLYPVFKKNFDEDLLYNQLRYDELDKRNITWFEWYLEYNFFTYQEIEEICKELLDRSDSLKGQEETKSVMLADFYQRFVSRVQLMMKKFPSADAISVMGP